MPLLSIKSIMGELIANGRVNADDMALIAELVATCLTAGHPAPAMTGAERTRRWRGKRDAGDAVTANVTVDDISSSSLKKKDAQMAKGIQSEATISIQEGGTGGDGFNRFWAIFPRRQAKRAAMKAFAAAAKRATLEVILAGAERYAKEREREDPQFTKMPASWLNGDCWCDEQVRVKNRGSPFFGV